MYQYDPIDQNLVDERVRQFRGQTARYLAGTLGEDEFRQLRLRNGLYVQRHAPMLRVAVPYGLLSSRQLRMLAQALALPCVVTNDVHYATRAQSRLRDALIAIRHNKSLTEARREERLRERHLHLAAIGQRREHSSGFGGFAQRERK